jgi:hypothetical protein
VSHQVKLEPLGLEQAAPSDRYGSGSWLYTRGARSGWVVIARPATTAPVGDHGMYWQGPPQPGREPGSFVNALEYWDQDSGHRVVVAVTVYATQMDAVIAWAQHRPADCGWVDRIDVIDLATIPDRTTVPVPRCVPPSGGDLLPKSLPPTSPAGSLSAPQTAASKRPLA